MSSSSPTTIPSTSCSRTWCSVSARSLGDGPGRRLAAVVDDGGVGEQVGDPPKAGLPVRPAAPAGRCRHRSARGSAARVRSKLARSRSSLLTKTRRGRPSSAARAQAASVCASTPSTALTTTTTRSTTEQAARTSPKKSAYPGVSMMLSLTSPTWHGVSASESDMWYLISSGSKSLTVEPSSTLPWPVDGPGGEQERLGQAWSCPNRCARRGRRCGCRSRESVRSVLAGGPGGAGSGSTCPTRATSVALMADRQPAVRRRSTMPSPPFPARAVCCTASPPRQRLIPIMTTIFRFAHLARGRGGRPFGQDPCRAV